MAIADQVLSKLIAIKVEKENKKKKNKIENWVYVTFPPPVQFQNQINIQNQDQIADIQYEGLEDIYNIFQGPVNHTSDEELSSDSESENSDDESKGESGDTDDDHYDGGEYDEDLGDDIETEDEDNGDTEDNEESEYKSFPSEDEVESSLRAHQTNQTQKQTQRYSNKSLGSVVNSVSAHTSNLSLRETVSDSSLATMTSTARKSLTRRLLNSQSEDSSISSLEWDNAKMLTQLSEDFNNVTWFEDTVSLTSSTSEDVFFLDLRTSTPVSKRVTRSMSAKGDISPEPSPIQHRFNRRHRFCQGLRGRRRPIVKYSEGEDNIQETAAIEKSAARRL